MQFEIFEKSPISIDQISSSPVRALSWKEPFASLMLEGKIETRTWNTNYRGLVLVCATLKGFRQEELEEFANLETIGAIYGEEGLPKCSGVAIAIGRLIDCRRMRKEDEERSFVKFNPLLYSHIYQDVRPIMPYKFKGSQSWRELGQEEKKLIRLKKERSCGFWFDYSFNFYTNKSI